MSQGGLRLGDKWSDGIKTFLGIHTRGFPNMFIMAGPQGQAAFNFMSLLEQQAKHVTTVVQHCRSAGTGGAARVLDVSEEAEQQYVQFCIDAVEASNGLFRRCPSYYNAEGTALDQDLPYSAPTSTYFAQLANAQARLDACFELGE